MHYEKKSPMEKISIPSTSLFILLMVKASHTKGTRGKSPENAYFSKYGGKARKVIETLLEKYGDEGIENLENPEVLKVSPLNKLGRPLEIMKLFGGVEGYKKMIKEIEERLYK